ncbi:paraquat-inducible protein A, partial [Staphylococcus aureus]|uniref:paraquat-inducible protein A n=1 Tax=Staphylococcus aureus TaxID=1280 RepID=UPI0038B283D1
LLASLVRAGALAQVDPGTGAAAFGMVVVLTMLASLSFDPRQLWDAHDHAEDHAHGRAAGHGQREAPGGAAPASARAND